MTDQEFSERLEQLLKLAKKRKPAGYTDMYSAWLLQQAESDATLNTSNDLSR